MKITSIELTNYDYVENHITIEFNGKVNHNDIIPELVKVVLKNEEKSK